MTFQWLRIETIHPALVHVPVGIAPILFVLYATAALRRSAGWTFAGDRALWVGAGFAALAWAFGLVSNGVLFWPGGFGGWRVAHLVLGTCVLALFFGLSIVRWVRRHQVVSRPFVAATATLFAVVFATGYVGGEVLVFHSGMAVRGGAGGTLAPPIASPREPNGFLHAMGLLRAELAGVNTTVAEMVIDHPTPARFADVERHARALGRLATWLGEHPDAYDREHARPDRNHEPAANDEIERASGSDRGAAEAALEIPNYADILTDDARDLAESARAQNLQTLAIVLGRTTAACAGCHESVRWID